MRIIEKPSVYVVAKTDIRPAALRRFTNDNGLREINTFDNSVAESLAEVAGRLCYWSFDTPRPGGNSAYLDRIKGEKHGSILEHASYSFLITGVSRTLTHELVRHRAGWAYSQLSQRYVDESDCAFVRPVELQTDTPEYKIWHQSVSAAHADYCELVEGLASRFPSGESPEGKREARKRVRQTARSVLPGCTETKILATANCRAIRHFLEQRGGAGAEPEIRRLANVIYDIVLADSPNIFGDFETLQHSDGTKILTAKYGKV